MSRTPAFLVCDAGTSSLKIAGLTILDRLVVTAHHAGCGPITLVGEAAPSLKRATEMGIPVAVSRELPPEQERTLLISGCVITEAGDLKRVIASGGWLIAQDDSPIPVKLIGNNPQPVRASTVAIEVRDERSAREAEDKLWESFDSSADGLVDRIFNRPVGRPLSRMLVRTGISPNQVSGIAILVGLASAWLFAQGQFLLGALALQVSAILDCVDGELARALLKQSRLGKWLDLGGDQLVHLSVFIGLGIGVARTDPATPALALGLSAAVGVLLSFLVVVRALGQPITQRSRLLNKALEATANRDFSVLLLVLAIIGREDLFLWMAGIGIHVFWIALLVLQVGRATHPMSREPA